MGDTAAVRSVHEVEQGIYEYVEEQHLLPTSLEQKIALPVRLNGWLWRREGLGGIFHRYRRRYCVFQAQQAQLYVFSNEDKDKLLRHMILTKVTLVSRTDRSFVVQGYLKDEEETLESMARRHTRESAAGVHMEEPHSVYRWKEERFKAVSAKACSVWTHCFKNHMKSYALRRQKMRQEGKKAVAGRKKGEKAEEMMGGGDTQAMMRMMDPDFVFEDATKRKRRLLLTGSCFRGLIGSRLLPNARSRRRGRKKLVVKRKESLEHSVGEAPKLASHQLPIDPITVTSRTTVDEDLAMRAAANTLQRPEDVRDEQQVLLSSSDLLSVSLIWEDEELLSHRVNYDAIVKKEKLASGMYDEVWRATYRSQEVVIKSLLDQVRISITLPTSISGREVSAIYRRRRAILGFMEEIRIMSRLEHSRIVEFRGVALSLKTNIYLVMEYLPRGDLQVFLGTIRRKRVNGGFQSIWTWTKHQWRLAIDIIEGLVYLHSLNPSLVHGDIKSANVLLRDNLRAKLTDFGLSRYLPSGEDKDTELAGKGENSGSMSRYGTRACGTGRWMAPELIQCKAQSSIASDVYAFGIVLSEIDTCELPFHEREKSVTRCSSSSAGESSSDNSSKMCSNNESVLVRKIVANGWKPAFRVTCPEVIKKLAQDCLQSDPSKRPTSLAVAHRLRQAAVKRERPEALAAQAKAITSLHIR